MKIQWLFPILHIYIIAIKKEESHVHWNYLLVSIQVTLGQPLRGYFIDVTSMLVTDLVVLPKRFWSPGSIGWLHRCWWPNMLATSLRYCWPMRCWWPIFQHLKSHQHKLWFPNRHLQTCTNIMLSPISLSPYRHQLHCSSNTTTI